MSTLARLTPRCHCMMTLLRQYQLDYNVPCSGRLSVSPSIVSSCIICDYSSLTGSPSLVSSCIASGVSVDEERSPRDRFTMYTNGLSDVPTVESLSVASAELPGVHGRRRRRVSTIVPGSCVPTRISARLIVSVNPASVFTFDDIHVIHALPTHHYIYSIVPHILYFVPASQLTIPQIYLSYLPLREEDRPCGDRISVFSHPHVATDACLPSHVRHGLCVDGSVPSQRPLGVVRCCSSAVNRPRSIARVDAEGQSSRRSAERSRLLRSSALLRIDRVSCRHLLSSVSMSHTRLVSSPVVTSSSQKV